jgi:hypothetical protein
VRNAYDEKCLLRSNAFEWNKYLNEKWFEEEWKSLENNGGLTLFSRIEKLILKK